MQDYRQLKIWMLAHELVLRVYKATGTFPMEERFGITAQLRRSAASIATNIVEGAGRSSNAAFASFLDIAASSASESHYQLLLAKDLGYLDVEIHQVLSGMADRTRRMLTRLRAATLRTAQPRRSARTTNP